MRRNARSIQNTDGFPDFSIPLQSVTYDEPITTNDFLKMKVLSNEPARHISAHRFENTIETKVEIGDTLQAIALQFHCTVADIKRLNKIDRDNEIHARKVIKIPVNVHNVLLDNFPIVHKSGNSSPKLEQSDSREGDADISSIIRNPLADADAMLSEKLMVASVNSSCLERPKQVASAQENAVNNIIFKSKIKSGLEKFSDEDIQDNATAPLISDILDDSTPIPQLHRIKGPSFHAVDWPGSDCDMSWICLFVVILALCFVIPLIYVFYIAEHSHHNTTGVVETPHL